MLRIEDIDLVDVASMLARRFGPCLEEDYLDGRTLVRDALVSEMACSELEAEELVDTLESCAYLRFPTFNDETHPNRRSSWTIGVPATEH